MDTTDYTSAYAEFYDTVTAHRDYKDDCKNLLRWLERSDLTQPVVLDFGCGTGSHLFQLISMGFRGKYWGIEPSAPMRKRAESKGLKNILTDIDECPEKITHIYSLYNVLNCIPHGNLEEVLFNISQKIVTGGEFLFEIWNRDSVKRQHPQKLIRTFEISNNTGISTFTRSCTPDISNLNDDRISFLYEIHNQNDELVLSSLHNLYLHDIERISEIISSYFGRLSLFGGLNDIFMSEKINTESRFLIGVCTQK